MAGSIRTGRQIAGLDRLDGRAETGVVFQGDLQERRLDLGDGLVALLIAADLQARELFEHFLERKLHLRLIGRGDRAQENFRHLLVNGGERNGRFPARHSSFHLGRLQQESGGSHRCFRLA